MNLIIEKLKSCKNRETTKRNYLCVWRNFNKFVMRLDFPPNSWEQRTVLFCAFLVEEGLQSSTIRLYVSAIKCVLKDDGYPWQEDQFILTTLTRACSNVNDRVTIRRPIRLKLLENMLFEIRRLFATQPYLSVMYLAFFCLTYYGLFRVGELAKGDHPVLACDVENATNKKKLRFILRSSKTHHKGMPPQKIVISATGSIGQTKTHFCPFQLVSDYIVI